MNFGRRQPHRALALSQGKEALETLVYFWVLSLESCTGKNFVNLLEKLQNHRHT